MESWWRTEEFKSECFSKKSIMQIIQDSKQIKAKEKNKR